MQKHNKKSTLKTPFESNFGRVKNTSNLNSFKAFMFNKPLSLNNIKYFNNYYYSNWKNYFYKTTKLKTQISKLSNHGLISKLPKLDRPFVRNYSR